MNDLNLLIYINFFAPAVHHFEQIISKISCCERVGKEGSGSNGTYLRKGSHFSRHTGKLLAGIHLVDGS